VLGRGVPCPLFLGVLSLFSSSGLQGGRWGGIQSGPCLSPCYWERRLSAAGCCPAGPSPGVGVRGAFFLLLSLHKSGLGSSAGSVFGGLRAPSFPCFWVGVSGCLGWCHFEEVVPVFLPCVISGWGLAQRALGLRVSRMSVL
jgi:hypothetical protein